ncbi:Hypothetical predicted protein [Marmota monax]|uniref:Uncharacterized protein n=1 Tax=Marmota monax TaxID=9995 RepID=A0A5E4CE52_MARMO|nr:Hypothetical predicted protein [Marmota monax]
MWGARACHRRQMIWKFPLARGHTANRSSMSLASWDLHSKDDKTHWTLEESESQRGEATCPRMQRSWWPGESRSRGAEELWTGNGAERGLPETQEPLALCQLPGDSANVISAQTRAESQAGGGGLQGPRWDARCGAELPRPSFRRLLGFLSLFLREPASPHTHPLRPAVSSASSSSGLSPQPDPGLWPIARRADRGGRGVSSGPSKMPPFAAL